MGAATRNKGRGATANPDSRFSRRQRECFDDGWTQEIEALPALPTTVTAERARSIISHNRSPDVPFEQSINPYRGCEHGCVYCFARPSHSYLDLSPGLDFETRLFYKENAVELLEAELRKPGYRCKTIVLGINTDAYQPVERRLGLTRRLLELMAEYRHPVSILTKGITILRDLELLEDLARDGLVSVSVSLTTLDNDLKRRLEPRTASPAARLRILSALHEIGIQPGVMVAPVIPAINDHEIESILESSAQAGAVRAGYVVLRLPHELKGLFREWLATHYPERASHVMSLVRQLHGGRDYDPAWGKRQTGRGEFAKLISTRFQIARRRFGLAGDRREPLNTAIFRPPTRSGEQMALPWQA
ncbi:PA0069 family radical SAM protein [Wenzhouxiangella sp. XN201]|uniref:PA0069 family radical SAM protein n=1 Tax=Wenzhouxiangella sp. XN201 TaxID=2710755 RepID=UPI0013C54F0C|nr:PA0069 family radical SAM protein [Wenzhouxiangella sp. XN201]NEZ02992.1 PA0069 family radical SAM protein [Wenzhouxiangella sp. XN201]